MNRGVLLFAFNTPDIDYVDMAVKTAKRVNHFLNLPVSIVTDSEVKHDYQFDNVIIVSAQSDNVKEGKVWNNKGRYRAYELTPYDETILLDTDYLINSDKLLSVFDFYDDFCCHDTTSFILNPNAPQEIISSLSFKTLWATVIVFRKTLRTKQIFESLEMVQSNYQHYVNLHKFIGHMYRNDYGLTFSLRIVNGHLDNKRDTIPWNLLHADKDVTVYKNSSTEFNTEYMIIKEKQYITVRDCDFHMMGKQNFMEIV